MHQIYVFDGGSSDNTYQIVEDFVSSRGMMTLSYILCKNPGKYVANARNLALEIVPDSVEYLLEMIGHCSVQYDHIETLIGVMGNLQDLTGNNVAALGAQGDTTIR